MSLRGSDGRYSARSAWLYPKADWAPQMLRAKTTLQAIAMDPVEAYFHNVSIVSAAVRARMLSHDFSSSLDRYDPLEVFREVAQNAPSLESLELIQYLDLKTYLPGDILTKVDRASMANSLEVRVPMLDHEFVEWAVTLPSRLKLNRGEGKYVLKRSFEGEVPHEILYRPKMGFSVPLAAWFRGPLRSRLRDKVLGPTLAQSGIFDMRFLERMVSNHESGGADHSTALWALLMFGVFVETASL